MRQKSIPRFFFISHLHHSISIAWTICDLVLKFLPAQEERRQQKTPFHSCLIQIMCRSVVFLVAGGVLEFKQQQHLFRHIMLFILTSNSNRRVCVQSNRHTIWLSNSFEHALKGKYTSHNQHNTRQNIARCNAKAIEKNYYLYFFSACFV